MIYISTGGFKDKTAAEVVEKLIENKIFAIELSGGKYESNLIDNLRKLKTAFKEINLQVHNYFPPPKDPFVFNLGSLNKEISLLSFEHAKKSIALASILGSKYYSFHAGFLIDPSVKELGKRIKQKSIYKRKDSKEVFIKNVNQLALFAKENDVKLLIENNVLSKNNYESFKQNILLMTDTIESFEIMNEVNKDVKMLVDVAHLKVSSNSLKFDPILFLKKLDPWIFGYHLSDNNGEKDSNETMTEKSWFWPYLKKGLDYYTIEVYKSNLNVLKDQKALTKKMLAESFI